MVRLRMPVKAVATVAPSRLFPTSFWWGISSYSGSDTHKLHLEHHSAFAINITVNFRLLLVNIMTVMDPEQYPLPPTNNVPNNPLPALVYRNVLPTPSTSETAKQLCESHGWEKRVCSTPP